MEQQIWLGILDSERYYRYFTGISHKRHRLQRILDILLLVLTASVVGILITHFLQGASQNIALALVSSIIGGVTVWQWRQQYSVKAVAASMIATQYKILGEDWKRQWYRGQGNEDQSVILVLQERLNSIASQYDFDVDTALNRKVEKDADSILVGEFGTSS